MSSPESKNDTVVDTPAVDYKPVEVSPTEPTPPETSNPEAKEESTTTPEAITEAQTDNATKRTPKTRLLKDVEEEERRYIYESLYKAIEDDDDREVHDHLTFGDTVRFAKEAKAEFYRATSLSAGDKLKQLVALLATMASIPMPFQKKDQEGAAVVRSAANKQHNRKVLNIFVLVTVMMFTLPLISLSVGMHVLAPRLNVDPVLCGGFLSVATVLGISIGYTFYGLAETAPSDVAAAQGKEALKQKEAKTTTDTESRKKQ